MSDYDAGIYRAKRNPNTTELTFSEHSRPKKRFKLKTWVEEFVLLGCVLILLAIVARPLADGNRPLGLNQRYAINQAPVLSIPTTPIATDAINAVGKYSLSVPDSLKFNATDVNNKPARAQWLNRHAGEILGGLAACGWICLSLGRSAASRHVISPLIAICWCITAHLLGTFSTSFSVLSQTKMSLWLWTADLFVLLFLIAFLRSKFAHTAPARHLHFEHSVASAWVYPGFVLFCGLGWLWLLDWAARGHLDKQFIGIYQLNSLWLAFALFTLVAAYQGPLLAAISRFASGLDNVSAHWIKMPDGLMLAALLTWTCFIVILGHFNATETSQVKIYQRHAALLAELIRVPIWLALGWIVYRWVETRQRPKQGVFAAAALLMIMMLGLKFDHDGGAMLAQTIAGIWIFCGVAQGFLTRRLISVQRWLMAGCAAVSGTAIAIWLAFLYAPKDRISAMHMSYQGPLDFLSMIHWLLHAAPTSGFGVGNTPWCGYEHVAELLTQCKRAGVPDQIQSDYVAFAMLSVWGWLATLILLAALLLWLCELMRKGPSKNTEALNFDLLRQWIVTGFAVTSIVQIVISAAGTLGRIPLTGLAIPMLSLGGTALMSTAIFTGLSVNRTYLKNNETKIWGQRL